jgi:hypothetical protein
MYEAPTTDVAADGAPVGVGFNPELAGHQPLSAYRAAKRRFTFEGPRGASVRASVGLRYVSYGLVIILGSVVTGACLASTPGASSGGEWMLLSSAFQLATAVLGSWFVPPKRPEIIQQVRAYVFGYTVLPGTGIAVFMWAASHMTTSSTNPDVFITAIQSALPWIFFLPIILPAVIFMKSVAGMRVLNREQLDDQENMKVLTRNDGYQR